MYGVSNSHVVQWASSAHTHTHSTGRFTGTTCTTCMFFCVFFSGHCVQVVETVASACHVASACQLLEYAEPQKSRDYSQR